MSECGVCGEPVNRYKAYVEVSDDHGWAETVYHGACVKVVPA